VETSFAAIVARRAVGWAEVQSVKLMVRPPVSPAVMVLPADERCSGTAGGGSWGPVQAGV
jgi:hypothetical protein